MFSNKLIVFDLFGVLFTKGLDSSIDHLTAVFNRQPDQISKTYRKWEIEFDLGKIDEITFWENINFELKTNIKPKLLNNIVISSYRLKEDTILLVDYLKKSFPVVVYSNYRREWFDILDFKYHVSKHFDKIYISSETKVLKPDSHAFDIIKKDFKINNEDTILIDDEDRNIKGFTKWGGKAISFSNIYETEVQIRNYFKYIYPKYDDFYSGILLITKEGALILQRRDTYNNIENPGKLSVFGGRREINETAEECAIRELFEETALKISLIDLKPAFECAYPIENGNWMLCNYYIIENVDANSLEVLEGQNIEIWKPIEAVGLSDITSIPKLLIEKLLEEGIIK